MNDLLHALRQLRRSPGFAVAAILTLALGIGATTAVFSVVDTVLLRPLPYPDADRLVRVWHHNTRNDEPKETLAYETFQELPGSVRSIEAAAGVSPRWSFTLRGEGEPERLLGYWVSASFFELLGVRPAAGRSFLPEEDREGVAPVALISHALWQRRFGGDPAVVGRTLTLGSSPVTVVGVMPPGFRFGDEVDVWMPLALNPIAGRGRQVRWVDVVARLAPGATVEGARSEIGTFMERLAEAHPAANAGLLETVEELDVAIVGDVRPTLWALLGGVGLVLLLTCANASNLFLTRLAGRKERMATLSALGASRGRIVRQTFLESVLVSSAGAAIGAGLAFALVELLRVMGPADLPRLQEVAVDLRILGAAGGMAAASGILVGLSPAVTAGHAIAHPTARLGRGGFGTGRLGKGMISVQVGLALVLLVAGGLLLRSFAELTRVDPGFRTEGVLALQVAVPGIEGEEGVAFYRELFAGLEGLPGVRSAGGTTRLPPGEGLSTRLEVEDRAFAPGNQPEVEFRRATRGYFAALGIPLARGRGFEERDGDDAPPVMLVNETAARRLWPGEDAVGKRARFWYAGIPPDAPWLEVAGVTGDVRHFGLDASPPPVIYVPFSQGPPGSPYLAIRTEGDPRSLAGPVRERIRELAPEAVIWNVEPLEERVARSVAGPRFSMLLVSGFAALAVFLAGVGIYGVVAFSVRARTREIGVRMALGAWDAKVVRTVAAAGLVPALAGLGAGAAGGVLGAAMIEDLLFNVGPGDPTVLGGVTALLALVAFLASWLPARRAAGVDPAEAIRHE